MDETRIRRKRAVMSTGRRRRDRGVILPVHRLPPAVGVCFRSVSDRSTQIPVSFTIIAVGRLVANRDGRPRQGCGFLPAFQDSVCGGKS
jgi:hypothetical protein